MTETDEPLARYGFRRSVLEEHRTYSLYPDRIVIEGGPSRRRKFDPLAPPADLLPE